MIRKNSLFIKLNHLKSSSVSVFHSFMRLFKPELEVCPICGSRGNCHIHDYYGRTLIDLSSGQAVSSDICVMRVFCDSCEHAHAILPDIIVPYSRYSLFFILSVLADHFTERLTVSELCDRYPITEKLLYKWIRLWHEHKSEWLGILEDASVSDSSFVLRLFGGSGYSTFSMDFILKIGRNFLQSHKNPLLKHPPDAHYHQKIFSPDYHVT